MLFTPFFGRLLGRTKNLIKAAAASAAAVSCAADSAMQPPAGALTLLITATNQRYNARSEENNGGQRQNAQSIYAFTTNADRFYLTVYGSSGNAAPAANVAVNGAFFQAVADFPANTTGTQTYLITGLPGSGERMVEIISAIQQDRGAGQPVGYVTLTSVSVLAGYIARQLPAEKNWAEAWWIFGDSRTQGAGHYQTDGYMNSWPRYLSRHLRPACDIYLAGHSNMQAAQFMDTPAKRTALVSEYQATVAGYTAKCFYYASGTNEYGYAVYTPQQTQDFLVALARLVLAQEPGTRLVFETPALRTDEMGEGVKNGLGYTLAQYRTAIEAAVAALDNAQVRLLKGPSMSDQRFLADGVHDSLAGDQYHAQQVQAAL